MKKRILSLALALVMALSCAPMAGAAKASLPAKDVLSTLSSQDKEALFDNLLRSLECFVSPTVASTDEDILFQLQDMVSYSRFPFENYGGTNHWGYYTIFPKNEFSRLTTELYGRTIDYSRFTRSSLPGSPYAEVSFLYNGKFYLTAIEGGWSIMDWTNPLHLYQLNNSTFCAVYQYYWGDYWEGTEDLVGTFSTIVTRNANKTWSVLHRYPNGYIPTADELSAFVAPSSWAKAEVEAADAAGLIPDLTGDPGWQDASTRLQFCQLAVQLAETALGETLPAAPANTFTDCSDLAVRKAYAAGIVNGMTETTFSPNGTLTREQLATMLWRAVNYIQTQSGEQALTGGGSLTGYTDAGSVSSYAKDAVAALNKNGIMKGTSNTALSPKGSCTVEQSVLLSYRTFLKLN